MKSAAKPMDTAAEAICFGVEIETMIPAAAMVTVGRYHAGATVTHALVNGQRVPAPRLAPADVVTAATWRADRDGSIRCDPGYVPCEFVSPVLRGRAGLANLRAMVSWIVRIGGKVNDSCGLHITVGIKSATGAAEVPDVARFLRTLCHIAHQNAWAIYAQTGKGRHESNYSHVLRQEVEDFLRHMTRPGLTREQASNLAVQCGRGMINLRKAFLGEQGAVEFRAFAGTLDEFKILHHLATAIGLVRRAVVTRTFGGFQKSTKKNRSASAPQAVRRLWRILGWCDATGCQENALGLFGDLHAEFGTYRRAALQAAEQFESRYPAANL